MEKNKEHVISTVKNNLEFIFDKNAFNKEISQIKASIENQENYALEKSVNSIRNYLYLMDLKSADTEKITFENLEQNDKVKLRKTQSDKVLFVEMFLTLFTNKDTVGKFKVI